MKRLPPEIKQALDATGLPWTIELGSRHWQIRVDGRLVGILPRGTRADVGRHVLNSVAQIKRSMKMKGNYHEQARR